MTLEDRIQTQFNKIFELINELQKELSDCQGEVKSHLDSSIVRVAGYDKDINGIQGAMIDLDARVKKLEKYIADLESKKNGLESLATALKWILGTLIGLVTLYTFWGKK